MPILPPNRINWSGLQCGQGVVGTELERDLFAFGRVREPVPFECAPHVTHDVIGRRPMTPPEKRRRQTARHLTTTHSSQGSRRASHHRTDAVWELQLPTGQRIIPPRRGSATRTVPTAPRRSFMCSEICDELPASPMQSSLPDPGRVGSRCSVAIIEHRIRVEVRGCADLIGRVIAGGYRAEASGFRR